MTHPTEQQIYKAQQERTAQAERVADEEELPKTTWLQEQPPWEPFDDRIDEDHKRKPPTLEVVKQMDQRVKELGQLFDGSKINWHLDGALNISLYQKKYIGEHKDVDISVEEHELVHLEKELAEKGYAFFLSSTASETERKRLRRVGHEVFRESETEHLLIAAIDAQGNINRSKELNFVDVHLIERNEQGKAYGLGEVELPDEWFEPQPIEHQGQTINLSHPGKVLYYKLHHERDYDFTDTDRLVETGALSVEDIDQMEGLYKQEFAVYQEYGKRVFTRVVAELDADPNAEQIYQTIIKQPEVAPKVQDVGDQYRQLAEKIRETDARTAGQMFELAMKMFHVEKNNQAKLARLKEIRQRVEEQQQIRGLEDKIKA